MQAMDRDYWRLWSLDEIVADNDLPADAGVLFSDYCMDCYGLRLKCIDDMVSEAWADGFDARPPIRVAASLAEFLNTYMENPHAVLDFPAR
ncbi:hypothetical protein [Massilia aquatica]|uniref:Uncharacterized protein n=1 Tax=Massilia aquatica TaxID=2609000 RepID=A0ABX0M7K8_9BURK|nr:hypothetical protein [Massilia aquatica]NHZ40141.1 hypothetical protein [Massilia aquatica]